MKSKQQPQSIKILTQMSSNSSPKASEFQSNEPKQQPIKVARNKYYATYHNCKTAKIFSRLPAPHISAHDANTTPFSSCQPTTQHYTSAHSINTTLQLTIPTQHYTTLQLMAPTQHQKVSMGNH